MNTQAEFDELRRLCCEYRNEERGMGNVGYHFRQIEDCLRRSGIPGVVSEVCGYENADDGLNGVWICMHSGLALWVSFD